MEPPPFGGVPRPAPPVWGGAIYSSKYAISLDNSNLKLYNGGVV